MTRQIYAVLMLLGCGGTDVAAPVSDSEDTHWAYPVEDSEDCSPMGLCTRTLAHGLADAQGLDADEENAVLLSEGKLMVFSLEDRDFVTALEPGDGGAYFTPSV
jgi:hypothetical protein